MHADIDEQTTLARQVQEFLQRLQHEGVTVECSPDEPLPEQFARLQDAVLRALSRCRAQVTATGQADDVHKTSETTYRTLFENMTEEVHFWQLVRGADGEIHTWRLVDANPPTLNTWGKTLDEIRGKTTDEIFGPGATEHYLPVVQKITAEGVPYRFEDYFPNLDKYFQFTSIPLGDYFITTGADITGIKKAQQLAEQQGEWLSVTLTSIGDAVISTDTTGSVTFLNPVAEALTGWSQQDAVGQPIQRVFTIINEQTREPAEDIVERTLREGTVVALANHTALLTRDGREIAIEDSSAPIKDYAGSVTGVVLVFHDVTARRRAQEALRESERRERERAEELAAILEAVPTPVIIVHTPDCLHMTGNRLADELFRQPTGTEISLSAPEHTRPHVLTPYKDGRELRLDELPARRAARGELVRDFEYQLVFEDGVSRDLLAFGTPLLDEHGQPRGAVHVLVDITERKRTEEALRESEERFRMLFDTMSEGFCLHELIFDEKGKPCDIRHLAANPAYERHTGIQVADFLRKTASEIYPGVEPIWLRTLFQGRPDRQGGSFSGTIRSDRALV